MDVKKEPKFINATLPGRPILIVGEKMGRQRAGQDKYALEGNRTGDFVHEAIQSYNGPVILTNIVNWFYEGGWTGKYLDEGLRDLCELIDLWEPNKVIALGGIAQRYIRQIINSEPPFKKFKVINFPHPSWINRFKSSERSDYILKLRHEITNRISAHS